MSAPLSGVRVLDAATFLAAPFCGALLAEFGAEVIKIEQPGVGDPLRRFGTPTSCGDTFVWLSEARNKRSLTLDLRQPRGADLFRRLVAKSHVVVENFRPGTMKRWGLDYDALCEVNRKVVMLSISAYGQTGPYRELPGFARIAHAFGGLAHLSGEPARVPVVPGSTSLADYLSGLFGAIGVLIALRHAEKTGEGQQVDIGLYESVFRVLDEIAPVFAATGFKRERMGADTVNVVPHSHYRTSDGEWVALACSNDRMWRRLACAMGTPYLGEDSQYATMQARLKRRGVVNQLVSDWIGSLPLTEVLKRCGEEAVPCMKLLSIADIFQDPQFAARENMMQFYDPRVGSLTIPSPVPRMSKTPAAVRSLGPALGKDSAQVLESLLGLDAQEIAGLHSEGIV